MVVENIGGGNVKREQPKTELKRKFLEATVGGDPNDSIDANIANQLARAIKNDKKRREGQRRT